MGSGGVLMLGHSKGCPEGLSVESHTHHHMTQCWGLCGMAPSCRREATKGGMDGNNTKQDGLSTEPAKQQQTMASASKPSEPAITPGEYL
jgi:hypothetical protein